MSSSRMAATCSRSGRGSRWRSRKRRARRRMEAAGVEVLVYKGDEISARATVAQTCLTRPVLRG